MIAVAIAGILLYTDGMETSFYELAADAADYVLFGKRENGYTPIHFHSNFELIFVSSGQVRVLISGEEKVLSRGELAFSSGYDVHFYETVGDSVSYVLLAGGKYMTNFYAECGHSFIKFLDASTHFAPLNEMFVRFCGEFEEYNDLQKTAAIELILGYITRHFEIKSGARRVNSTMVQVLMYLEEHYRDDISLGSLASKFGYTKTYLSSLFNRYIGTGFRAYLNSLRVRAVNALIKKENIAVTKAVFLCGFDSLNTYYRAKNDVRAES